MDFFKVDKLEDAGYLLVVGALAGILFYLVNKYALTPAERTLGLTAAA